MQNHEFIGPVSQSTQDVDWLGCVELCASRTDCVSYNFKMSASFGGKGLCELIDTKAIDDDCDIETLLVYENGVIFHQLRKANEVRKKNTSVEKEIRWVSARERTFSRA